MRIGLQTWGTEGDVQPFIALAAGLVRAGHEVTLVVTDNAGRNYHGPARRFGFRLVEVRHPKILPPGTVAEIWRQIIDLGNPLRQAELVMRHGFDPVMEDMYAAAQVLCSASDAVVGHFFAFPLRVAAETSGVPMATLNTVHNGVPSATVRPPGLPDLGQWSYPLGWMLVRKMLNGVFLPRVNALRSREGLAPDRDVMTETWASDRLNLIAVSPSICQPADEWDDRHELCGFLNTPARLSAEECPHGLDSFIEAGELPVYFTFGSMMLHHLDYIRDTAALWTAAVRKVGCRAILQLPWDDLSAFPAEDGIFAVKGSPHREVFPKCSLVVHHGGAGTTQASLLASRPSVVVAHMADQFFWGSELERLGVAGPTQRRKGLSSKRLANSIAKVLGSPDMSDRARAIGNAMSEENGVDVAVNLIEARLG